MMIDTRVNIIEKNSAKHSYKKGLKLKRKALFHHHPKPKRFLTI